MTSSSEGVGNRSADPDI